MLILGLTGKTGAGKSTVAAYLKEKGCFIIDGDAVAREIVTPPSAALKELAENFGEDILLADGSLDRKALATKAFSSKEKTDLLNSVTHPHIKRRFEELISKAEKEGFAVAVIDAAALLESDCKDLCQKIIVVHADEKLRFERILRRDGISPEQAMTRINGQREDNYYFAQADVIIQNGESTSLETELNKLKELLP